MIYNRLCGRNSLGAIMLALAMSLVTPAFSATLPTDNEQEILVKTTLMTFNDANLTGNYSVLFDKSSKAFRSQVTAEKNCLKRSMSSERKTSIWRASSPMKSTPARIPKSMAMASSA